MRNFFTQAILFRIELNLEPENLKKYPKRKQSQTATCETCHKTIRTNTKRLSCIYCKNEIHLLRSSSYNIKITDSKTPATSKCSQCYFRELSFASLRYIEDVNENTDLPSSATCYVNIRVEKLKGYHEHLSIAYLNPQSMSSTFDKFQVMINENQFDIVILSKIY